MRRRRVLDISDGGVVLCCPLPFVPQAICFLASSAVSWLLRLSFVRSSGSVFDVGGTRQVLYGPTANYLLT